MPIPSGVFSAQLLCDAQAYLKAAEVVIRARTNNVDAPTYFLLSHALELTFKAYLVACGDVGERELRDLSHDIERAYEQAAALGLSVRPAYLPLIGRLSDFHKDFVFRYPVITRDEGRLVMRGNLVRARDALVIIRKICRQVGPTVLKAQLSSRGQFLIETWHMDSGPSAASP